MKESMERAGRIRLALEEGIHHLSQIIYPNTHDIQKELIRMTESLEMGDYMTDTIEDYLNREGCYRVSNGYMEISTPMRLTLATMAFTRALVFIEEYDKETTEENRFDRACVAGRITEKWTRQVAAEVIAWWAKADVCDYIDNAVGIMLEREFALY